MNKQAIIPTKEDREAAADVIGRNHAGDKVRTGSNDEHFIVQAFARHRVNAIESRTNVGQDGEDRARELLAAEYRKADLPYIFDLAVPNERDAAALRAITRALAEREAVVAWLRAESEQSAIWKGVYRRIAAAIERGEHTPDHMGVEE
jgi:hypothetical protein